MGMMWFGTYDQFAFWSLRSLNFTLLSLCSKIFCKTLDGASNATKIARIDKGLKKLCLLQMKGGHGHDVGCHIWPIYILELKIFGCHFIFFKGFVKFQMVHLMQQKLFTLMEVQARYVFCKWRGSWGCGLAYMTSLHFGA